MPVTISAYREWSVAHAEGGPTFLGWMLTVRRDGIVIERILVPKGEGAERLAEVRRELKAKYRG